MPFTKAQIDLIKNVPKPIARWSAAVSDKLTNSLKFRLLAISCISVKDMEYCKEHYKKINPKKIQNIQNNGLTFVFIINNDYSIDNIEDKKLLIKYSRIVNLFYEKDYIVDQDADDHFLILLTLSEFYKYHMKNKSTYSIQELKYPKRIYNSIIRNLTYLFNARVPSRNVDYAISNNGKLLAYFSLQIKGIIIYSIECGLEIAEFENILETTEFSSAVWAVWNIFSSLKDSVKLNQQKFILKFPQLDNNEIEYVGKSNSYIVICQKNNNHDKLLIYNDMVIDKYFSLKENLEDDKKSELQLDKLDKLYEPWLPIVSRGIRLPKKDDIQYSFYLDKKNEKLLIIGYHTVQVWYRGTLKFIHSPSPFFDIPNFSKIGPSWKPKKIEYNINVAKNACYTLEHFSIYKKKFDLGYDKNKKLNFDDFIKQTRKIILNQIRLYPTECRLLDIRFDLMSILVKAEEYELVYYILSFGELIHIPQYYSWSNKENVTNTMISTALSNYTMLAYFLEYYSKNANHNIGWMNTVVDIILELFKSNEEIGIKEKEFDLFYFEILKVFPKSNDLLKVYVPITQLIPQKSKLVLQEIGYDKIANLQMVPLMDFTTNKRISVIKKGKLINFLKLLFSPKRYLSHEEVDYSPFIELIKTGECDIFYENPSIGAVIK
ncbi:39854_t:CDS:2 [Gigaspora margarita]|uniref:39854_t:CDS:1 n=1 Tax=Gigaspora margarita TaxID=4874 RepID=A0ABM8W511_GIGMA|nr:39854_t:CDS:2 [Gigaspora margarita]